MRIITAPVPQLGARCLVKFALVLAVFLGLVTSAKAANTAIDDTVRARLWQIVDAVDIPRDAALARLAALSADLPEAASYAVRRELLQAMRETQVDAGQFVEAQRSNDQLKVLAKQAADNNGLADAFLHDAVMLLKQERTKEAGAAIKSAEQLMGAQSPAWLTLRRHIAYGLLYTGTMQADQAASHFLDALPLARAMPRHAGQETQAVMSYLAHMYNSMQDYQHALATADEALALKAGHPEPRMVARLHYVKALAQLGLNRDAQARQSFEYALGVSRKGGLSVLEAFILGSLADAELHAERWVEAERTARQALAVATRIGDEAAMTTARVNIGFALGGQGRVAEAIPFIDGVVAQFRQSGSLTSVHAVLNEKGRMLERAGMAGEALKVVREEQRVQGEVFTSERARAVAALQEKFDADDRRRQIELLKRDSLIKDADIDNRELRHVVTTLVAALLLVIGGFFYFLYRRAGVSNDELRTLNTRLEYLAVHDPLTGLFNRRSFIERMRQRQPVGTERRQPSTDAGDCLILLDLDHFKAVNDSFGHAAGDAVLVEVARRLQTVVRETDMVLRWGGEEFMVYAPGASRAQAIALVARILGAVGQTPVQFEAQRIVVNASAGFAPLPFSELPESLFGWERAVALADAALYLAKTTGRNRACGPVRLLGDAQLALAALEGGLAAAARDGFVELTTVVPEQPSLRA